MNFQEKTADLLYNSVKRASVVPSLIERGDLVVVTGPDTDTIGVVASLEPNSSSISITLKTKAGVKILDVANDNFIHVIQKDAMLDLREHYQYERTDEKMNKEVDMIAKNKDEHKERPEFSVDKSDKSNLPTSKISLSLRTEKEG